MVLAIKKISTEIDKGTGFNFHNFKDGKDINFSGDGQSQSISTNTWVPFQSQKKQIKIHIKNEEENFKTIKTFYLWDDNYKLQCSTEGEGMKTILTVDGRADIGINVNIAGVSAYFL